MPSSDPSILNVLGLGQPPLATVLLLHTLPDGSTHIDWMMARDAKKTQGLLSFRLAARLDCLEGGDSLSAEQIQDHRPAYLVYEGEISRERGHVRRLRSGTITRWRRSDDPAIEFDVCWDAAINAPAVSQQLSLVAKNPSQWLVNCVSMGRC